MYLVLCQHWCIFDKMGVQRKRGDDNLSDASTTGKLHYRGNTLEILAKFN